MNTVYSTNLLAALDRYKKALTQAQVDWTAYICAVEARDLSRENELQKARDASAVEVRSALLDLNRELLKP